MKQTGLWLLGGLLFGSGLVSLFSGGAVLLAGGLILCGVLFVRYRGAVRGWSAAVYGLGASVAVLLLPYVLRPPRCAGGTAGCYTAFTLGVFAVALVVAGLGLALGWRELSRTKDRSR